MTKTRFIPSDNSTEMTSSVLEIAIFTSSNKITNNTRLCLKGVFKNCQLRLFFFFGSALKGVAILYKHLVWDVTSRDCSRVSGEWGLPVRTLRGSEAGRLLS